MCKRSVPEIILGLFLGFFVLSGCGSGSGLDRDEAARVHFVLQVRSNPAGFGSKVLVPNLKAGWPMDYPGVTAFRANHQLKIREVVVSPDGKLVCFSIVSQSALPLGLVWFTVKVKGADLATPPRVVNGRGENVFVAGPLPAAGRQSVVLEVKNFSTGYNLELDFMEVFERIAFDSNRSDPPGGSAMELFTVSPDGRDRFQLTRNSNTYNGTAVWSPGAEWLAFERVTPMLCGSTERYRPQIFEIHPDGASLTQRSVNVYFASSATYNPNGNFLAYDCRPDCMIPVPDFNICRWDRKTNTQTYLFKGDAFYQRGIFQPRWSPDGRYMVMNAKHPISGANLWVYAEMDPWTGDSLSAPAILLQGNLTQRLPDGNTYRIFIQDFTWAPDSRHVALDCIYYQVGVGAIFEGIALADFQAMIQSPTLPVVPVILEAANVADGIPHFPRFDATGTQLWFDNYLGEFSIDLQYVELTDYTPRTGGRITFIHDDFINRIPALFRTPRPEFFPL